MNRWAAAVAIASMTATGQVPAKRAEASAKPKTVEGAKAQPEPTRSKSAPPAESPVDFHLGLRFSHPPSFRAAQRTSFTLANGLRVHLLENRELPQVTGLLFAPGGSFADPPEKGGLAEVAARAIARGGVAGTSGEAMAAQLERLGANFDADASPLRTTLRFRTVSESVAEVLPLFAQTVRQPGLDPDSFELLQGQMRNLVTVRNNDPSRLTRAELVRATYGASHPLGRYVEYEHIDNTGIEDVAAYHGKYFAPGGCILAIEGDFATAEMKALVERSFSGWQGASSPAVPAAEPVARTKPGIYYAERRDLRRSWFAIGGLGARANDADYPALLLLAQILAGGQSSRLAEIGTKHPLWGLEVNAAADADYGWSNVFTVTGSVNPPYTTDFVKETIGAISRLRSDLAFESELEQAKLRWQSAIAQQLARPSTLLGVMTAAELAGLPMEHLLDTQRAVMAVTAADLRRVAQKRLEPDKLVIVTAGSETLFDRPLADLKREVFPVDLTIPGPRPFAPREDPQSIEQGKQWLARIQKALGGAERLAGITAYSLLYQGAVYAGTTVVKGTRRDRWMTNGPKTTFRQDVDLESGKQTFFYDGEIGWAWGGGRLQTLTPAIMKQIRGEMFRSLFRLASSDRAADRVVSHLGANIVQVTDKSGLGVRIYVDPETGLPQRLSYQIESLRGTPVAVEELPADWKEHGGVMMPGRWRVKHNGRRTEEFTLVEAKVNEGVDVAEMEKKP